MPESDMSVLTPTLCSDGRESLVFAVVVDKWLFSVAVFVPCPVQENIMAEANTKKHPIPRRDEMRMFFLSVCLVLCQCMGWNY